MAKGIPPRSSEMGRKDKKAVQQRMTDTRILPKYQKIPPYTITLGDMAKRKEHINE
jgi:hypothetical protein